MPKIITQGIEKQILYFTDFILSHVLCTEVIIKKVESDPVTGPVWPREWVEL